MFVRVNLVYSWLVTTLATPSNLSADIHNSLSAFFSCAILASICNRALKCTSILRPDWCRLRFHTCISKKKKRIHCVETLFICICHTPLTPERLPLSLTSSPSLSLQLAKLISLKFGLECNAMSCLTFTRLYMVIYILRRSRPTCSLLHYY